MSGPLPCFVCGSELKPVFDGNDRQPSGAVTFRSPGQYGSTVFDPASGLLLELNICDGCLTERHGRAQVARTKQIEQEDFYPWDPEVTG